jgi:hypothetical protein
MKQITVFFMVHKASMGAAYLYKETCKMTGWWKEIPDAYAKRTLTNEQLKTGNGRGGFR